MNILHFLFLFPLSAAFLLQKPQRCQSSFVTLHDTPTSIPQNTLVDFMVSYQTSFHNIPELIFGISGITGQDPTYNELMHLQILSSTLSGFQIQSNISTNTQIIFLTIRYFSVDDEEELFEMFHTTTEDLVNISVNAIQLRTQTIELETNTELTTSNTLQTFLTGFWLRSSQGYQLQINTQILDKNHLALVLTLERQSYLELIGVSIIVFSGQNAKKIPFIFVQATFFYISSTPTAQQTIFGSETAVFLVAIKGFYSSSSSRVFKFNLEFSINSTLQVTNNGLFDKLYFSSFVYGLADCGSQIWNPQNQSCLSKCPSGYTQTPSNRICQVCESSCSECSKSTNFCSACLEGFVLVEQAGLCSPPSFDLRILASLAAIPCLSLILVYYLVKKKKKRKVLNNTVAQHPSIQF